VLVFLVDMFDWVGLDRYSCILLCSLGLVVLCPFDSEDPSSVVSSLFQLCLLWRLPGVGRLVLM